jgi:hypothetical protein
VTINLGPWLIHTLTRKCRSGAPGSKGEPSYTAADTIKARVEKKQTMIRGTDGREIVSEYQMATSVEVKLDDVFWFPSIAGEPADNTADISAARSPRVVNAATDKQGKAMMWRTFF